MRYKLATLLMTAAVTLVSSACGEMANTNNANMANANANANVNANHNAEVANRNANDNANTSRRGPTREDYEREKDRYTKEAKDAGRKIGTGLNDGWLWVKTRYELAAADDLRDSTIDVDVDNDVVTLTGTVATPEQRARAESVAKSIEGVKSVKNMLKVSPSGNTDANANANMKKK